MMTNYELEFRMIPAVLDYALGSGSDEMLSAMVDRDFWIGFAERKGGSIVNWDNFQVKGIDYSQDWVVIAFEFPEPQQIPEACFGAIFFHKSGKGAKYFTLEKSTGENWALCSPEMENHQLLNICSKRLSQREFLDLVADYCTKRVGA